MMHGNEVLRLNDLTHSDARNRLRPTPTHATNSDARNPLRPTRPTQISHPLGQV